MAYDLTGKSVQRVELAVTNCGYNSLVKVIMAKQNDRNSRFIHAIVHDANSIIDCSPCTVQLNGRLPDGTALVSYGEIIKKDPYVLIPSDFLSQVGRVTCDITLTGTYKDLKAGVGNSTGISEVNVDEEKFSTMVTENGRYTFMFEDNEWKLDNAAVSLSTYGIEVVGTPANGDNIVIDYSTTYTLTTETFYIIVEETNYDSEAEEGQTDSSFMDYVKGQLGDIKGDIQVLKETAGTDLYLDVVANRIYLTNGEDQILGNGIDIPATVNGFVTETDENGNTYLYLAHDGEIIGDGILLPQGGGSGGGGSSYVVRVINNLGTTLINAAAKQPCELNFTIAEYYGQDQTNTKAIVAYMVKRPNENVFVTVKTESVDQGTLIRDVSEFLGIGNNSLRVVVTGGESGITKTTTYTINVTEISMTSSFNYEKAYNSNFNFPYKCQGKGLSKTVYFKVDDEQYGEPIDVGTSHNIQLSQTIDLSKYGHGSHKLEVYFITNTGAKCPSLIYDVIYYKANDKTPIIASSFDTKEVTYGNDIEVKYTVFTAGSDYTESLVRSVYTYAYEQCESSIEGALLVIDNNVELTEGTIHIQDVGIETINVGDYVVLARHDFSSSTLTNIINAQEQKWVIQEYPEKGKIFIELKAGTTVKTFEVFVNEIDTDYDLEPISTRLVASFNTNGRSNSDVAKTTWRSFYTSLDGVATTINATLEDFDFVSNGWVTDEDNSPVLRHSGKAKTTINLPILAANYKDSANKTIRFAGSPSDAGRTIEIEFNIHDVTNYNAEVIKCFDAERGTGFVITPRYAYLLANTMTITKDSEGNITNRDSIPAVTFKDGERIRVTFVIENVGYFKDGTTNKQMVRIYINGELCKALNYSDASLFGNNANIVIQGNNCIADIYSLRAYDMPLEDSQVLRNYIADKNSVNVKLALCEDNDVLNAAGEVDYYACMKKYPCILVTGTLSGFKGDKTDIGIIYTKPDKTKPEGYNIEMDCMDKLNDKYVCQSNVQGTSSQRYAKKNYKFTFKNVVDGVATKSKYKLKGDDSIGESTLCYKADYMSISHPNTANANYLPTLFEEAVPPQENDSKVQIAVYGYRCLLFQRDSENDTPKFQGDGCLNNDKGNTKTFGLENEGDNGAATKCQKWEFLDNSEDICNFKTDKLMQPRGTSTAVLSALESCYPDQGDLEDEGLTPDYSHIQILYSWVCQRANYWTASKDTLETPVEYNGVTYTTEYDYKKAIFENEFTLHFNKNHALTYYIGLEIMALVDNRAKNMFLTCYDVTNENIVFTDESVTSINDIINAETGAVDISKIDWENSTFAKWYPSLYDLDSCLGLDNSGYNMIPYDAEWDYTYNNQKLFNGADSYLWKMIETSLGNDIATLYRKLRDTNKTLSYAKMYDAHITNNAALVCPTIINQDQRFKYIDIWTEGYNKYSDDNSSQSLVKTPDYLYLVQGSKEQEIASFMYNRMNMLDSKYKNASYKQDKIEMRIGLSGNTDGENVALNLTPVKTMYCYAEYGNSGELLGAKTEAGKSVNITPVDGNYGDILLSIYGASNLSKLGSLAKLKPYSVDVSCASKLEELILGSTETGYSNDRLTSLDVSACKLLHKIDIRNTGVANTLDLSNCSLIEEVYAQGSKISEVSLPQGGYLSKLHLPNTITTFVLRDQIGLEEFSMAGADALQTLCVENCSDCVMTATAALLRDSYSNLTGGIRLTNINWDLTSEGLNWTKANAVKLINGLASDDIKGKQINALGNLVDDENAFPTITGEIYVGELLSVDDLTNYDVIPANYPNLKVWSWTVQWKDRNGVVVKTDKILNEASAFPPTDIEQTYSDGTDNYRLTGWNASYDSITEDTTFTPVYSKVWTVRFIDGQGNVIGTPQEVVNGQSAIAPETNPENYTDGTYKYTFKQWNKDFSNITENTDVTAVYDIYWTVKWTGHNDEILKTEDVIDGNSATPPEVADYVEDGKTYTFTSWDSAYAVIRADITIKAQYTTRWTVTWNDYDGTLLKTEQVLNGLSATPPTATLTRPSTTKYVYTHTGWDKAYTMITSNTVITARYTESLQNYTVKFYKDMQLSELLYTGSGNFDGTCLYSGEALDIPDGYYFMGWKDTYGKTYDSNLISLNADNCRITQNGTPIEIQLYALIEVPVPGLPQTQKNSFSEFTWLEIKALGNAIVAGTTTEVEVTYDETEKAYSIHEIATDITSVVALHDTKDIVFEDGTVQTVEVADFLHDDDEYGNKLGISFVTKDLYKTLTKKHYSSSHALMHYKVNDVAVADNSATYTHTQGDTAGNVVIESTGDTYISELILTDADGFITTWRFNTTAGTDDDTHKYYNFAKADNVAIGTTKTWNGITINASQGAFALPDYYTQYFVSAASGCKLTIPVTAGSTLEIKGYTCYNLGGWEYSELRTFLNDTLYPTMPALLKTVISGAKKGSSIGGYAYDVRYFYDKIWALSTAEMGWSTTTKPYKDEGTKYPIFTDNASRIKKYNNGEGSANIWWLRSPIYYYGSTFHIVYSSGDWSGYNASNSYGVAFGFAL